MREGRINLDYSKQYCILSPCTSGYLCTTTCYKHVTNMPFSLKKIQYYYMMSSLDLIDIWWILDPGACCVMWRRLGNQRFNMSPTQFPYQP